MKRIMLVLMMAVLLSGCFSETYTVVINFTSDVTQNFDFDDTAVHRRSRVGKARTIVLENISQGEHKLTYTQSMNDLEKRINVTKDTYIYISNYYYLVIEVD